MTEIDERTLALFYCQNVPGSGETERQDLELRYGKSLRLFPIPCSGRLEPLHLLRALEDFADAAYVVTCPEGLCRYFEGYFRRLLQFGFVTQEVRSRETKCTFDGAPYHEYHIAWK